MSDGKIPIAEAKMIAHAYGLKQCLIIGYDGARVHVTTYGETPADCELAAQAQDFWTGRIREFSFREKVETHDACIPAFTREARD